MTPRRRRGRWAVDIHFRNPDGSTKRVQKVSPIQTETAARVYEKQVLAALARGEYRAPRKEVPTVEKYLETFLTHAEMNQKKSTHRSKQNTMAIHVVPLLGNKRLDEIGHPEFEKLKGTLLERELTPKTINNTIGVLSSMLGLAKKQGLLTVRPPIDWLKPKHTEEPPLTPEEFERLVEAAEPEWRTMLRFAVLTGLRIGEICELKWSDVDVAGWVHVRRAVYMGKSDSPKHGRQRKVPLHVSLLPLLKAHRRPGVDWVFYEPDGKQLKPYGRPAKAIARAARVAVLGRFVGWHLLRHTWASWLGAAGVPAKTLMALGGWGSLAMVARYVNLGSEDLTGAISRLGMAPAKGERHG